MRVRSLQVLPGLAFLLMGVVAPVPAEAAAPRPEPPLVVTFGFTAVRGLDRVELSVRPAFIVESEAAEASAAVPQIQLHVRRDAQGQVRVPIPVKITDRQGLWTLGLHLQAERVHREAAGPIAERHRDIGAVAGRDIRLSVFIEVGDHGRVRAQGREDALRRADPAESVSEQYGSVPCAIICDRDIELLIAVPVRERDTLWSESGRQEGGCTEPSFSVAALHTQISGFMSNDEDIGREIGVPVSHREGVRKPGREAARAIAEQHADVVLSRDGNGEIGLAIAVEVRRDHSLRAGADLQIDRRPEVARAVSEQHHGHGGGEVPIRVVVGDGDIQSPVAVPVSQEDCGGYVADVIGHGEIGLAVAVPVADRHRERLLTGGEGDRGVKSSFAITEHHADRCAAIADGGKIGHAIAVEVTGGDCIRLGEGRELAARGVISAAIAEQEAEAPAPGVGDGQILAPIAVPVCRCERGGSLADADALIGERDQAE